MTGTYSSETVTRASSTNGSRQRAQVRRTGAVGFAAHQDAAIRALQPECAVERAGELDVGTEHLVVVPQRVTPGHPGRLTQEPRHVEEGHGRGAASVGSGSTRSRAPVVHDGAADAVPLVEHVDAALDAGEGLDALALEPDQDAGRVLVRATTNLGRLPVRGLQDLARALLRHPHQLPLLEHLGGLLLGPSDHRVPLLAGAIGDAARLLGDPLRLADLIGYRDAQLVDELEHGRLLEHDVVRERQLLAGRDQALQTLDEEDDVRGRGPPGTVGTRRL